MLRRFTLMVCGFFLGCVSLLRADLTSPVLVQPIPAQSLGRAGSTQQVNLHTYLQDPNVPGTAVRMTIQVGTLGTGNIDIALTDAQTPITVGNFLAYINAGRYANNLIHRSDPGSVPSGQQGFVIQGGAYAFNPAPGGGLELDPVPTFAAIQNEPGISNVRGTIAMAKISGNVNSATSQWFINLSNTNTFLDDSANGAFTVFGRVIGGGMNVADIISQLPIYSIGSGIDQLPLTAANIANTGNFVITNTAVVPSVTYAASSNNTSLVTTGISGNTLTLTPSSANIGNTNITITATDLEGAQLQANFTVTVLDTYANWKAGFSFGNATLASETANPDGDNLSNLAEYAFGGDPLHAQAVTGAPKAESGGGVTFYVRQQAALSYEVDVSTNLINWTKVWQTSDGNSAAPVFSRTILSGFDQLVIRYPGAAPGNPYFWRVQVTRSL